MTLTQRLSFIRVQNEAQRVLATEVVRATYQQEKNWILNEQKLFPVEELGNEGVSWFLASDGDRPVGVLRVLYDLPLDLYQEYGFKFIGGVDLDAFIRKHKIAEIGRFAVLPEYRRHMSIVGVLMREASRETIERGYTHYVTDIFEGEVHSPYHFHTRVLGFVPVATHDTGELNCPCRRITMLLDIRQGYDRLKQQGGWLYRCFTEGWPPHVHAKVMAFPVNGQPAALPGRPQPAAARAAV